MTDFVVSAVQEAAQRAIEQAEIIRLSLADQECFAQALLSPPGPIEALQRAFERRRRLLGRAVTPLFEMTLLDSRHDRTAFDCGAELLNRYFSQQVSQDVRRRVTACYVALSQDGRIAGFYTLASTALLLSQLPTDLGKKLPRYPTVPAVRMGRLALDQAFKGSLQETDRRVR